MPLPGREGKGGLRDALAQARAAELGRLAGEAARALGCGDAGLGAAEQVIRAGLLRPGGAVLGEVLSADQARRNRDVSGLACGRMPQVRIGKTRSRSR